MRFVFFGRIEFFKEITTHETSDSHGEVEGRWGEREKGTFSSWLSKIEGEHIYHWWVNGFCERYNDNEEDKADDEHSKEHGDGCEGGDDTTEED